MDFDIVDFIDGDKKAFDCVYARYAPAMFGICRRYTNCKDDAQEVLQESFVKVYEHRKKMDPTKELGPWIKTITIRTAINFLRKQKRLVLQENDAFFETIQEEEAPISTAGMKEILLKMLSELPDGYRAVFNMYVLDGLTHKEIADYLEISEGTSKSQLAKAKNWIKNKLEKELKDERI